MDYPSPTTSELAATAQQSPPAEMVRPVAPNEVPTSPLSSAGEREFAAFDDALSRYEMGLDTPDGKRRASTHDGFLGSDDESCGT